MKVLKNHLFNNLSVYIYMNWSLREFSDIPNTYLSHNISIYIYTFYLSYKNLLSIYLYLGYVVWGSLLGLKGSEIHSGKSLIFCENLIFIINQDSFLYQRGLITTFDTRFRLQNNPLKYTTHKHKFKRLFVPKTRGLLKISNIQDVHWVTP